MNEVLGSLHDHDAEDWTPARGIGSGEEVLKDAVRVSLEAIGDRLIAAYALGSLAHGGFSPLVSDVDLALILADPIASPDGRAILGVAEKVRSMGSSLHTRLSIFWGTPASLGGRLPAGRFPPLDRLCLLEHGRLLAGEDVRNGLLRPNRAELVVTGAQFALDVLVEDVLAQAKRPDLLVARGVRWTTKIVLFPVRFLFTAETGREGTSDAAANHYVNQAEAPGAALVAAALRWRIKAPARDEAIKVLGKDLAPLYVHYLGDHIKRLESYKRNDLVQAFRDWRSRLVSS